MNSVNRNSVNTDSVNRRDAIKRLAAGAVGAAATATLGGAQPPLSAPAGAAVSPSLSPSVSLSFHGPYQAGIFTPAQRHAVFAAFDVTVPSIEALRDLFRTLTTRARFLTAGGEPAATPTGDPPADSGVLGPTVSTGQLTITVSVGASLFDRRFGLADRKPVRLTQMSTFANDALEPNATRPAR